MAFNYVQKGIFEEEPYYGPEGRPRQRTNRSDISHARLGLAGPLVEPVEGVRQGEDRPGKVRRSDHGHGEFRARALAFRHLAVRTRDALHATISKKITILAVFPLVCCNYSIILYYVVHEETLQNVANPWY